MNVLQTLEKTRTNTASSGMSLAMHTSMIRQSCLLFWAMLFGVSILGSLVHAREDTKLSDFEWRKTQIVYSLLHDCVTEVGDLDLKKLETQLQEMTFLVNYGPPLKGSGGRRSTAVHFTEEKVVILNAPSNYDLKRWDWDPLLLHEGLGALGYDDEDYQLSTALSWLSSKIGFSKLNPEEARAYANSDVFKHFRDLKIRTKNKIYIADGGGSTSTGGGGDLVAPLQKWVLLTETYTEDKFRKTYRRKDGTPPPPRYPGVTLEELESAIIQLKVEIRKDASTNPFPSVERGADGKLTLWINDTEETQDPTGRGDPHRYIMEEIARNLRKEKGIE